MTHGVFKFITYCLLKRRAIDPDNGRTYFYHTVTKATTWELPAGAVLYTKKSKKEKDVDPTGTSGGDTVAGIGSTLVTQTSQIMPSSTPIAAGKSRLTGYF